MLGVGTSLLPFRFVVSDLTDLKPWVTTVMIGISLVAGAGGYLACDHTDRRAA